MSPILVRPVREQFEHDRVIRLLQTRWRRRYEVGVNLSGEPPSPLRFGRRLLFPDLVLYSHDGERELLGVVEVETNASINHLEAMSQWMVFARVRAPFHLYIPLGALDAVRRLCDAKGIFVEEIWTYHTIGAQVRWTLAYRDRSRATKKAPKRASSKLKKSKKTSKKKNVTVGRKAVAGLKTGRSKKRKTATAKKTKTATAKKTKTATAKKTTKSPKRRTAVAKKTARKTTKLARSRSRKTSVKS
ncbi:MAG: hypothetical protein VYA90_02235 [Acidobacteriota bacterium]|nr:hypothetical protein [Acidobacteriota bacterium]